MNVSSMSFRDQKMFGDSDCCLPVCAPPVCLSGACLPLRSTGNHQQDNAVQREGKMVVQSRCLLRLIFLFTCSRTAATHIRGEEERRKLNEPESEIDFERRLGFGFTLKDEASYISCPQGYPAFGELGKLLRAWSPNDPEVPEGVVVERLKVSGQSRNVYGQNV